MKTHRRTEFWAAVLAVGLGATQAHAGMREQAGDAGADGGGAAHLAQAGVLRYGDAQTAVCFSGMFLRLVGYASGIGVEETLRTVDAESEELFTQHFVIWSGEGAFALRNEETENLRAYMEHGGMIVASAGCANGDWAVSFEKEIGRLFPDIPLEELAYGHEAFGTLYEVQNFTTTEHDLAVFYGIYIDGRLALVYTPEGLNDTANAATMGGEHADKGCCCCPGRELRQAMYINANLFVYALVR